MRRWRQESSPVWPNRLHRTIRTRYPARMPISPVLPVIPDNALEWRAIRSPGPGGQNVNKVATAIQLRVYLAKTGLPPAVRARLEKLAGRRVSTEGALLIEANRFRSQERNRADAWARFEELLTKAMIKPKRRVATRVPHGQKQQRMDQKSKRGGVKRLRGRTVQED